MEEIVKSLFHFATIDHAWNDLMTAQEIPCNDGGKAHSKAKHKSRMSESESHGCSGK